MKAVVHRARGHSREARGTLPARGGGGVKRVHRLPSRRRTQALLLGALCLIVLLFTAVPLFFSLDNVPQVVLESTPARRENPTEEHAPTAVEGRELERKDVYTVAYVMPVGLVGTAGVGAADQAAQRQALLSTLFAPLLSREAALCYRRDRSFPPRHGVPFRLRAIVVAIVPPSDAALSALLVEVGATLLPETGAATRLGATSTSWTMSTAALRDAVVGGGDPALGEEDGHVCYEDNVTLVALVPGPDAAVGDNGEPVLFLESYVAAALDTPAGRSGDYFLVVPAHIHPTRAPFTVFGDETRQPPYGFVESLLMTATQRNRGRVAAVQCAILKPLSHPSHSTVPDADGAVARQTPTTPAAPVSVPVPIPQRLLSSFLVVDRGGFVGATVTDEAPARLLPFLTRRYSGLRGSDQRVFFEEPISGVSLQCGLYHKGLHDAVGGLAAALQQYPTVLGPSTAAAGPLMGAARTIHFAADSAGWKLSLRMQRAQPDWQVYASRAVAVWRHAPPSQRTLLEEALEISNFALIDGYGRANYRFLQLLQARRFGLGWQERLEPLAAANEPPRLAQGIRNASHKAAAAVGHARAGLPQPYALPPIITYSVDFPCTCCGLGREASNYIRPLMERYTMTVDSDWDYCPRAGADLLSLAYRRHRSPVFGDVAYIDDDDGFWRARARERAHVNFLHSRAPAYVNLHMRGSVRRGATHTMTIGRSLSEFSNVSPKWVAAFRRPALADQLWATGDFFRDIYRNISVPDSRIRVVPEAVDTYEYDPANAHGLAMPFALGNESMLDNMPHLDHQQRHARYVFLSSFKWELRKGWDVLLGAYYDAFGPTAPVELRDRTTLIIKTRFRTVYSRGLSALNLEAYLRRWVNESGSLPSFAGVGDLPHLIVTDAELSNENLVRLYKTADAFVFPSRAEGWGLPAAEAMSMGLPVLATDWGGLTGFLTNDTAFLIPIDGIEELPEAAKTMYGYHEGKSWAMPSRSRTAELMRYVVTHPEHAREVGRRARQRMVRHFSEEVVADKMDSEIAAYFRAQTEAKHG